MKILVLGGTGSIGSAVVELLLKKNHQVLALGRTPEALDSLRRVGATAVAGDLREPSAWISCCDQVDGVVHAAAAWGDQMAEFDRRAVEAILQRLQMSELEKAFVYTGGCWLYGETGDVVATESSKFKPLESFAWSIDTIDKVLSTNNIRGMVIHPAMVYDRDGGVFEHIFEDVKQLGYVRVVKGEGVRWPLIHRADLAELYLLMLEKGEHGDSFNAATNHGVAIGKLTRTIARRLGVSSTPIACDIETAKREMGSWAEGYAIDQQMSGDKARSLLGWKPKYEDIFAEIA